MRNNTKLELEFQKKIVDAFTEYDIPLGFPVMFDVMIAWLIHEARLRGQGQFTYWQFLKVMTKTWRDLTKYQAENNPL